MRAIHLFPDLGSNKAVSEFRAAHDPLAFKIPLHVTLVFPFESEMDDDALAAHVGKVTKWIEPFPVTLGTAEFHSPDYIWLPVLKGAENIRLLHAGLYSGPLAVFRNQRQKYRPHVTIGRVSRRRGKALVKAGAIDLPPEIRIDNVVIEKIGSQDESEILHVFPLIPAGTERNAGGTG